MEYIKIKNSGEVDLTIACNIIGGSAKIKDKTIGMFGSGLKYALAQSCRQNIEILMTIGKDKRFKVSTYLENFREVSFKKVCFINLNDGDTIKTPIAINYGQHDWTEKWFIYREIISNALDENGFGKEIVNEIVANENETSFFLKYDDFKEIFDHHDDYFCNAQNNWVRTGKGFVYRNGVYVGKIDGINLDWQNDMITISESRQVDKHSALYNLSMQLNKCDNVDIFCSLLKSVKKDDIRLDVTRNEKVQNTLKEAFLQTFGEYAISPDDEQIQKDLKAIGIEPIILPEKWKIDLRVFPSYKKKINPKSNQLRDPSEEELKMIQWGIDSAKAFSMLTDNLTYKVVSKNFKFHGQIYDDTIYLREDIFNDRKEFLETFLHEIGHFESKAHDYEREFARYFIKKIIDFIL